jgi:hypothetical protein
VQHDAGVLADRVEHHRMLEFGDGLAHDLDRLRLGRLRCVGSRSGTRASDMRWRAGALCVTLSCMALF